MRVIPKLSERPALAVIPSLLRSDDLGVRVPLKMDRQLGPEGRDLDAELAQHRHQGLNRRPHGVATAAGASSWSPRTVGALVALILAFGPTCPSGAVIIAGIVAFGAAWVGFAFGAARIRASRPVRYRRRLHRHSRDRPNAYAAALVDDHIRGQAFGLLGLAEGIGEIVSSVTVGDLFTVSALARRSSFSAAAALVLIAPDPYVSAAPHNSGGARGVGRNSAPHRRLRVGQHHAGPYGTATCHDWPRPSGFRHSGGNGQVIDSSPSASQTMSVAVSSP